MVARVKPGLMSPHQSFTHIGNTHMKRDVYAEVTAKLVASIEAGIASGNQWAMPWRKVGGFAQRPTNATTNRPYHGINTALLWGAGEDAGYTECRWATFKQWQAVGASVRKGEKGTMIVFFKPLEVTDGDTGQRKLIPLLRSSYVFNIAQVDNVPERLTKPAAKLVDVTERLQAVDVVVAETGAEIRHGGDAAFYVPSQDFIAMPLREQFKGDTQAATERYYSTLLHELVHWTGHASRLDRLTHGTFGTKPYAFEELVAELGAAFLCADLGVNNEPREDHAQYLASWLRALKDEPRAIFKAASLAEKAVGFVLKREAAKPDAEEPEAAAQAA